MRVRSISYLLILAAVGGAVFAGCGGGGGTGSSGEAASFASGAEAACARANERIAALGTPGQEQVTGYLETTESVIEKLHREVVALEVSGAAETAYTEALAKAVPVLTEMTNAARNENYDAVRELSAGLIKLHLGELAEAAGLKTCAKVPVSES